MNAPFDSNIEMVRKTSDLYDKLKNKLSHVVRLTCTF